MELCVEPANVRATERLRPLWSERVKLDVGRSWRTRKGAQEARGRQQADPGDTSVESGEASDERLRVFEAETEVQERDRSRTFYECSERSPPPYP
jgi:predicted lipoprotein